MTSKLENSNRKCRYEGSSNQDDDEKEAPVNIAHEVKSITNIYYDCLEHIFDYLELQDLLNVAGTCKRLQIAAAVKFGDVYGKERISICPYHLFENEQIKLVYRVEPPKLINVRGIKTCLAFLRCFGSRISNLCVVRHCPEKNYVDQYVNQYCADTVLHIDIYGEHRFHFTKPFKNVENLLLWSKSPRIGLSNWVKWFPKLRCLRIHGEYTDSSSFRVFIPQLEQLNLILGRIHEYEPITDPNVRDRLNIENAKELLHANQQLSYIDINSWRLDFTMTTLLDLISKNTSILKLCVDCKTANVTMESTMEEIKRLIREHRFIVDLDLYGYVFTGDQVIIMIRQLSSLKKISVLLKNRLECEHLMSQKGDEWKIEGNNIRFYDYVYVSLQRR